MKFYLTWLLMIILLFHFTCLAQEWRGLRILRSTRADVEKLLGVPKDKIEGFAWYDTKEEKINIWYASGKCGESDSLEWKVDKDIITKILIYPQQRILLLSSKLDLKQFEKDDSVIDRFNRRYYYSPDKSIEIEVDVSKRGEETEEEEIVSISYRPKKEYYHLMCPESLKKTNTTLSAM